MISLTRSLLPSPSSRFRPANPWRGLFNNELQVTYKSTLTGFCGSRSDRNSVCGIQAFIMGNPSHKTHPASIPGQAGTLCSPASLDSCCPHVTALTRKAVLFYNMDSLDDPHGLCGGLGIPTPFSPTARLLQFPRCQAMAFPPYIGAPGHQYHVQICPSCNRACTIKIGWCTMSDMENSDTTPFHVEVWGVEPLSVVEASSVASLLCCRCLPSLSPRQPVEGLVKKNDFSFTNPHSHPHKR